MKRHWIKSLVFFSSGFLSILLAFTFSMRFLGQARSEENPSESNSESSEKVEPNKIGANGQGENFPPETENNTPHSESADSKADSKVDTNTDAKADGETGFVELSNSKKVLDEPTGSPPQRVTKTNPASDGYIYDPSGKRDPFLPFMGTKVLDKVRPESNFIDLEPLQKFDLNKLEVLAILWDVAHPRAMIKDPSGEIHMVTRGQKVGRNDGYIVAIREGEIVVMESFEDGAKIVKEPKILSLKK
jgi:type IV pilus assembly protein PilP